MERLYYYFDVRLPRRHTSDLPAREHVNDPRLRTRGLGGIHHGTCLGDHACRQTARGQGLHENPTKTRANLNAVPINTTRVRTYVWAPRQQSSLVLIGVLRSRTASTDV